MVLEDIIIVQRDNFTIADKPACVSTVPDKTGHMDSLMSKLEIHHKHQLFPITRLDKVVSGLCLFAHSSKSASFFTKKLQNQKIQKTYIAIVEGKLEKEVGELVHFLKKHGAKTKVHDKEEKDTKKAHLAYTTILALDNYTVLKVTLETGRFHQIRGQFSHIGHSIKGDIKYGARRKNKDRSIHLHAYSMVLPGSDEVHIAPVPETDKLWLLASKAV